MIIHVDTPNDGTHALRISDDKSRLQLLMEYDPQLEYYSVAIRDDAEGEVEPCDPIRRRDGEDDDVYFDRASSMATRIYLNRVDVMIEQESRYQRMQPILAKIQERLNHMQLTCAHWDNDKPTEADLNSLMNLERTLANVDSSLTDLT